MFLFSRTSVAGTAKRNYSVTFLRGLATLLIVNSHFAPLYPKKLSFLAFGGMFGDILFFMISGFCLANVKDNFPLFYLKRIKRVYLPYLLFLPILIFLGKTQNWGIIDYFLPYKTYGFLTMILLLYPFFYVCIFANKKISFFKFEYLLFLLGIAYFLFFFLAFNYTDGDVLEFVPCEIITFFSSMIIGAWLSKKDFHSFKPIHIIILSLFLVIFLGVYTIQSFLPLVSWMKLFQWLIGFGVVSCLFAICLSIRFERIKNPLIDFLAGITLEIYFVNYIIIEQFTSMAFPLGLVFCLISICAIAFIINRFFYFVIDYLPRRIIKKLKHEKN